MYIFCIKRQIFPHQERNIFVGIKNGVAPDCGRKNISFVGENLNMIHDKSVHQPLLGWWVKVGEGMGWGGRGRDEVGSVVGWVGKERERGEYEAGVNEERAEGVSE